MKSFVFDYMHTCLIDPLLLSSSGACLMPEIKRMQHALTLGYATPYAFLNISSDTKLITKVNTLIQEVRSSPLSMLIIIGIGGSNLGTIALFQALYGTFHNDLTSGIKLYCADTLDTQLINSLVTLVERELQKDTTIVVVLVTKSGTTTETLVNGAFFVDLLKKYRPDSYRQCIVAITDAGSPLHAIAQRQQYQVLEIPRFVGGRYSVLSAVGLFPLALMGVEIHELMAGAHDMLNSCIQEDIPSNSAALSALIGYTHFKAGKNIHDTFLFSPDLLTLGNWYRQLVGESLGKKHNNHGQVVETGITPTVSIGSTDLHSVAQLYLGGPRDKLTTFVRVTKEQENVWVPDTSILESVPSVAHKSVNFIKDALFKGVQQAYIQEERPFMTVSIAEKSAYALGQFIMFKMCEVVFLASLLEVNAFDQPAVELYKEHTRKILGHG